MNVTLDFLSIYSYSWIILEIYTFRYKTTFLFFYFTVACWCDAIKADANVLAKFLHVKYINTRNVPLNHN